MYELKVKTHFAAAHQLKMVNQKCENLHGHNWHIEIYVRGDRLNSAGVVIDFGELKTHINQVIDQLDHKFLNELPCFKDENPSSENIAEFIASALGDELGKRQVPGEPEVRVAKVTAWESEDAAASFIIED